MKKYLMKTTDIVDNIEKAMVQIREQQNFKITISNKFCRKETTLNVLI